MHVISNRMIFDTQTRRVIGFAEPIVHVFNKNEFTGLLSGMTTISGDDATCDNSSSNNDSVHHLHGSMDSLADTKSTVIIGGTQLTGEDGRRYRESLAQYKQMISHRRNVILMGDSLGDIQMGHGVRHDVLLSVGYLNQYQCMPDGRWVDSSERQQGPPTSQAIIDKTVQQYLDTFDIVISADSGLDVLINPLLQALK
jgi:hypothetical protein